MRKIILYTAASQDGFIAASRDDMQWLFQYPHVPEDDGVRALFERTDTVLVGGRTYFQHSLMSMIWIDKAPRIVVVSHNEFSPAPKVSYITKDITANILALKREQGKDIMLFGGGVLASMLIDADLIDEIIIDTYPLSLSHGKALFPGAKPKREEWAETESQEFENGVTRKKIVRKWD